MADLFVCYATTDPAGGALGIGAFLVPRETPGFRVVRAIPKLGVRTVPMGELALEDCELPGEALLGREGRGAEVFNCSMEWERGAILAATLGTMRRQLERCIEHARRRKQFGTPIGQFQLIQAKVADMYVALSSARAYVYAVAKSCDAGKTTRFDAAGAILLASESAVKVSLESIQALGGAGYTKDWPVERFMRDAKLLDIGAGTNEIRRMLIGRELIGAAPKVAQ